MRLQTGATRLAVERSGGRAQEAAFHDVFQRDGGQEEIDVTAQLVPQIMGDAAATIRESR